MRFQRTIWLSGVLLLMGAPAPAQQAQPQGAPTVIRTETKLVLVDVVVTGKKGVYVEDLELKNFKVWEDNKEQQLKTFSSGSDPNGPGGQKRYIVLFFDNSTMLVGEQVQARQAAARFIESNAGPDRLIAVVNFTNAMQVAQNFTGDIDRLKQVVGGIQTSAVARGPELASLGMPRLGGGIGEYGAYGARSMLLALRSMAKNLAEIPGRKSLILFTSGFPLSTEARSEANAAIDTCNKANVAIYPIDARGVSGRMPGMLDDMSNPGRRGRAALEFPQAFPGVAWRSSGIALAASPVLRIASFWLSTTEWEQTGGRGGGPTGGGAGGNTGTPGGGTTRGAPPSGASPGNTGGTTGTPGGTTRGTTPGNTGTGVTNPNNSNSGRGNNSGGYNNPNDPNNPYNRNNPYNNPSRLSIPDFPQGATDNQQVMYLLADGTGGFVINNTNDMIGGMQKIGKEQNSYYIVGYTPPESAEGSCHTLKVKVDKGGTTVRSRVGYCNVRSRDALAGNPVEKTLESRAAAQAAGTIAASMRAPFFYTGANTARVAVAIEIPSEAIKFEKVKGKMHAGVNVLGIAYKQDGSVAARFSDAVKLDFENQKEVQGFKQKPMHYENQFDVAVGVYNLKVVFDSGDASFGKLESPLVINAYEATDFAVSGVAFSTVFAKTTDAEANLDSLLLEGRSPLVAGNYQFTPTGYSRFKAADKVVMYFELYDPALMGETKPGETKPKVAVQIRILDGKTLDLKQDSGNVLVDNFVHAGSPVVPAGLRLPIEGLTPGLYRLELKGLDSTGAFATRTADFEIL
jgi:VWFA-related protein